MRASAIFNTLLQVSRGGGVTTNTHSQALPAACDHEFLRPLQRCLRYLQLSLAVEALLADACELIVVRAKDRLNNPTSFGYTDFLLNVRLRDGTHVGELQLHLEAIHAIKPACHRTYALLRQVSFEQG